MLKKNPTDSVKQEKLEEVKLELEVYNIIVKMKEAEKEREGLPTDDSEEQEKLRKACNEFFDFLQEKNKEKKMTDVNMRIEKVKQDTGKDEKWFEKRGKDAAA